MRTEWKKILKSGFLYRILHRLHLSFNSIRDSGKKVVCFSLYYIIEKRLRHIREDKSRPVLYFCHTPYHTMVALAKAMKDSAPCSIMLYQDMRNVYNISERIKAEGIFENVYISSFVDLQEQEYIDYRKRNYGMRWKKKKEKMERDHNVGILKDYQVRLFNDSSFAGYYLFVIKKPYTLLEDGLDCYEKSDDSRIASRYFHDFEQRAFSYFEGERNEAFGVSPLVRSVEVNNAEKAYIPSPVKIVECPKQRLFSELDAEQKKSLVRIFDGEDIEAQLKEIQGRKTLLLTQPLYQFGVLESEEQHILLYKNMVSRYAEGTLVVKRHPKDQIDYGDSLGKCIYIQNESCPIETLNYMQVQFDVGLTLYSTALNSLINVQKKIVLGQGEDAIAALLKGE